MDWHWFLFDWMPRSHCGPWTPALLYQYGFYHLAVCVAYLAIPLILLLNYQSTTSQLQRRGILATDLTFAAFILSCGLGHFLDFLSLWWVSYPVHTFSVAITALASWFAVCNLPSLLFPKSLASKLEETTQQLQILLRESDRGVYFVDTAGVTVWANRAVTKYLGWTQKDMIGSDQHCLLHHQRLRPDGTWEDYPLDECPIYQAFKLGKTQVVKREYMFRKDSTPIEVSYSSHPIRDGHHVIGAMVIFTPRTSQP